jgi:epoxyqueuosine reductase
VARAELAAIKDRAIARARELGAAAVRVTPASPDAASRRRMEASFRRGDFATWSSYDARYASRANDPTTLLPGARSVLCLALPYGQTQSQRSDPLHGRVSNYAWSGDYHREMQALLRGVAAVIDEAARAGVTAVACDTRPLAERAFAARAGLGWIGKHTNLISPEHGSFVFLGEIVTTLELPADAPLRKSCGACTRCVEVCPTRALRADYTIDATRCISDLTQRTDSIPKELRPLMGDWVWGCDLCQIACPPTAMASRRAAKRTEPPTGQSMRPSLVELLRMRSAGFKRRYANTAMGWRGAAVLRRNAAVALGNALDRSAVNVLIESLCSDPHPMVRGHVAWALGRIGSPRAVTQLRRRYPQEEDRGVRAEIAAALEAFE